MNLECNLFVDGEFEGTINSQKEITIGKNGSIKGEIFTNHLIVRGEIIGSVVANIVEIKSGGKVSGTVESKELIIEPKGCFEGNSIVKKAELSTEV
ncbi:Protein of unknown function, DUF583 superfamily [hydrothermal vent metagenome]|uniref:Polymer-forming bactofilin n=1 Tax=hydrothermal vent metagenome TaxID=652676 RepID=A0A1W1BAT6_9ZZZZ